MFPCSKCCSPSSTATVLVGCISKPKQVQIWWYEVRTVRWVQQYCFSGCCNGLALSWMSNTLGIFLRGQTQLNEGKHSDFSVFHCASRRSLLSPKETVAINFLANDTLLTFFFLRCVALFLRLFRGVRLKIVDPGVIWQFVTERPRLLYHICAKDQSQLLSLPLCVNLSTFMAPRSTDLEQPSSSTIPQHYLYQ